MNWPRVSLLPEPVPGMRVGSAYAGLRKARPDVALFFTEAPAAVACMTTTNTVVAAPVIVTREHLGKAAAHRAIIVNAGNANACTGERGLADARSLAATVAKELGCSPDEVLVASTGVIGVPLPLDKIEPRIPELAKRATVDGWDGASIAIQTTDTRVKRVGVRWSDANGEHVLTGIAKGAGMIHPNMATMLAFLGTSVALPRPQLQAALERVVADTWNMISVDGDTSTNDMVSLVATGSSGPCEPEPFEQALRAAARRLCRAIVQDGEGASRRVEVHVTGAATDAEARGAARAITRSPLVKTALHGPDANWGRILAAAGTAARVELGRAAVTIVGPDGAHTVYRGGTIPWDESRVTEAMRAPITVFHVELGAGTAGATAYGCDLSEAYVRINTAYRT